MKQLLRKIKSPWIKNLIYYLGMYPLRLLYLIFSLCLPLKKNRIMVFNYNGNGFGDNPKYVVQELLNERKDIEVVWVVKKSNILLPDGILPVKLYSLRGFILCSTSKVWISNARLPLFLRKRRGQVYFQLWHGGCGPKKIEGLATHELINWYISAAKNDSKMADYMVSNSRFNTKIFQKYFWYSGEILEFGSPRHDLFFKNQELTIQKVKKKFNIGDETKILLYAPTFRKDSDITRYIWDYQSFLNTLRRKTGNNWVAILRLHPNISNLSKELQYNTTIINGSDYPDMQELICSCDMLITDFSGVMMEAALAQKKVGLLVPDEELYSQERGLVFSLKETPFLRGRSSKELENIIENNDFEEYDTCLKKWIKKFEFYDDGHAAERVSKRIINLIDSDTLQLHIRGTE